MLLTRRVAALWLMATAMTLGSSTVKRMRLEVQDWDCPPTPASCARPVLVAGFPFPYVSDYHGISVVGRVSFVDALLGIDHFHTRAFWLNVDLYLLATAAACSLVQRFRRAVSARTRFGRHPERSEGSAQRNRSFAR
jgi:hypothetical protein